LKKTSTKNLFYFGLVLTTLTLFLVSLWGYTTYTAQKKQKEQQEITLISQILACAVYTIGYDDGLEKSKPAIGSLMSVQNQALLEMSKSKEEKKKVDFAISSLFISSYRLGFNDGTEQKEHQADQMLSELLENNPTRKEYIQDLYNKLLKEKKRFTEDIRDANSQATSEMPIPDNS